MPQIHDLRKKKPKPAKCTQTDDHPAKIVLEAVFSEVGCCAAEALMHLACMGFLLAVLTACTFASVGVAKHLKHRATKSAKRPQRAIRAPLRTGARFVFRHGSTA